MSEIQAAIDRDFGVIADLIRLHARQVPERAAWSTRRARSVRRARYADGPHRGQPAARRLACRRCDRRLRGIQCELRGRVPGRAARGRRGRAAGARLHACKSRARMIEDAEARILFVDEAAAPSHRACSARRHTARCARRAPTRAATSRPGSPRPALDPPTVELQPSSPFNIIYSSGTTGEPKGIVQGHGMRWAHVQRGAKYEYGPDTVTLLSTPLYSNTTLVVFFPTIAFGGCVVLMPKFDAAGYLKLAERHRVTHTMLVPVQYQRLMAHPDFDAHDLSSFRFKFSTSAPFNAALKADVLARWPGRPDRVLRHDRGRRHLHPRSPPASRQAAHRRPPGRRQRHPADRRSGQGSRVAARPAKSWATRRA